MFTAPVLLTVTQVGKDQLHATWEPYTSPDPDLIIFGSIQGFALSGKEVHVVGEFLYAGTLAAGEALVALDPKTAQGATVRVTIFVQASGLPSVESNALTFTYSKSGK